MFHDHGETVSLNGTPHNMPFIMAGNLAVVEGGGSVNYYWENLLPHGRSITVHIFSAYHPRNSVSFSRRDSHWHRIDRRKPLNNTHTLDSVAMEIWFASGLVDTRGEITLAFDPFTNAGRSRSRPSPGKNREPVITTIDIIPNGRPVCCGRFHAR